MASKRQVAFGIAKRRVWLVLSAVLFGLGCGGGPKGDISGKVTYLDKPLPSGSVTFLDSAGHAVGSSPISTDGSYSINGVPVGPMKILVTTPADFSVNPKSKGGAAKGKKPIKSDPAPSKSKGPPPIPPVAIPDKYSMPDRSDLTFTVQPGQQEFDIHLK